MSMSGITIRILLKRMGMYDYVSIRNMSVIKKGRAREKAEEKKQEKIPEYVQPQIFQNRLSFVLTNIY